MNTAKKVTLKWCRRLGLGTLITLWTLLTLDITWPAISTLGNVSSEVETSMPGRTNYLIIAPQVLGKIASAWAEYRKSTGYYTEVLLVTPAQAKAEVIKDLIQKVYAESESPDPLYVLLIGHAHPASSHPDAFLPAAYFSADPAQFPGYGSDPIPSDDIFARDVLNDTSERTRPIFIGRIPVRTEAEGFRLLERTGGYEQMPPVGEGRARIELVSSNAGFGPQYDPIFEWALRTLTQKALPDEYQWHMLYGNAQSPYSYPSHLFPKEVARRFDSGALALVYIGHGQPELLGWAYSPNGARGRIFGFEDAPLIQNANASLGIFTACSAGRYDLSGDDLSVVEAIFLTQGGPVATYSSSAWINGTATGRLLIDLFEALLIDNSPTLGEWVERTESESDPTPSPVLLAEVMKGLIPRISGMYRGKLVLSSSEANQELAIQHRTYNVFGDPALRIRYPQPGIEIAPHWSRSVPKGSLSVSGNSNLPAGQQVSLSMVALPGAQESQASPAVGTIERYYQENSLVLTMENAFVGPDGKFSGALAIPPGVPSGRYVVKAVSVQDDTTYVAAHPLYIGWPSIADILFSATFWWLVIGSVLLFRIPRLAGRRNR